MGMVRATGDVGASKVAVNEQLIDELALARRRIAELEAALSARAGDELVDSREQYQLLVEGTGQPITMCALDGTVLIINGVGARNLGGEAGDFIGKSIFEVLPELAAPTRERMELIVTTRRGLVVEDRIELLGGARWFESRFEPVQSRDGSIDAIQIVSLDITSRKLAEEALRESESHWRTLTESSPDYVMRLDLDGRIRFANRAIPELSLAEIIGANHLDFLAGAGRVAAEECFARVIASHETDEYAVEYELEGGGGHRFEARIGPVLRDGEVKSFVLTATDTTSRCQAESASRELEKQVGHAQKLDSLGMLAGGLAHDFNNLLMGILGNADLALHALPTASPAQARIESVIKTARRCADLTNQMLAYAGRRELTITAVDVPDVLVEIAELLHSSVSKRITLDIDVNAGLPAIEGDASQLGQVFMNLVINGAEAIGERDGLVRVSAYAATCARDCPCRREFPGAAEWPARACLAVEVSDTGCGMDAEIRARLFDPFFTTKFTGRGLGMAAVHGILRGHRAGIIVDSELGRGTVLTVHLPLAEARDSAPHADGEPVAAAQVGGTVLLVDDEEIVRAVAADALTYLGYKVLVAIDGVDALEVFRAHGDQIDCVILDLKMPRMDGEETFVALRELSEVPVMLSSGYAEEDSARRFSGKGLAGFIQKPYDLDTLAQKLTTVLTG